MNWNQIKEGFVNFLKNGSIKALEFIIVIILGIALIKIVLKIINSLFNKTKLDKITKTFLISILKFCLYIILVLTGLQILGIPITGLIAILSAAGLAISLALQNSLSNLANGIIIIASKPFKEGDYVSIDNFEGNIKTIKILTTTIITSDNKTVVLPNSKIINSAITNFNGNERRRIEIFIPISNETEFKKAKTIILKEIKTIPKIYPDPSPCVYVKSINQNNLNIFINCWCDTKDYWDIYYEIQEKIVNKFKKLNIQTQKQKIDIELL